MTSTSGRSDTGAFVCFEDGEGSGKATQSRLLRERLAAEGYAVLLTHEPGDTRVFADDSGVRRLDDAERGQVVEAYRQYLDSIPEGKRSSRPAAGLHRYRRCGVPRRGVLPYEVDLEWSNLIDPDEIGGIVDLLGRATAKVHCSSDEDSDQDLVDFQVEDAVAEVLAGRREEFTAWLTEFGLSYADLVRADHAVFVEAFRTGRIGVSSV